MRKIIGEAAMGRSVARSASKAAMISITLILGACSQSGDGLNLGLDNEKPKSVDIATASAATGSEAELEKATTYWGEQHAKNPRDPKAAIAYARNLKALGRKAQALSVMQSSYVHAPNDKEFLSEYGRLALDMGQVSTAEQLLIRADDPGKPDWRLLSARGTVHAKQGRVQEAIEYFEKARNLAPEQASVLNNLAMAYTMDGQAARGEALLRQAAGSGSVDPRVQQNLTLVMGLQSKPATSEKLSSPTVMASETAGAMPLKAAAWDKPLPIETAAAPVKVSQKAPVAVDPDEIIRRAMAAEHTKSAKP